LVNQPCPILTGLELERLDRAICTANNIDYDHEERLRLAATIDEMIQVINEDETLQNLLQKELQQAAQADRRYFEGQQAIFGLQDLSRISCKQSEF